MLPHRVDDAVQHLVPVLLGNGTHLRCVCLHHADACRQAQALATVKLQLVCLVLQQFDACRLLEMCNGAAAAAWPMQL
jgi:hypothetical protein